MPLQLEIVTPERQAYADDGRRRRLPGHRGRARRPAAPRPAALDARHRRAAHPQGQPGGVLRHRRRLPPGATRQGRRHGRDWPTSPRRSTSRRPRRRAARPSGRIEQGFEEPADLARARAAHGAGAPAHPRRRAAPPRGPAAAAAERAWQTRGPFHWEYEAPPVAARDDPHRGRPPAARRGRASAAPRTPR